MPVLDVRGPRSFADATLFAHVTLFPTNDARDVDVSMPWSHVQFSPADCTHYPSGATTDIYFGGRTYLRGTLRLTCKKDEDQLELDVSYSCPVDDLSVDGVTSARRR